MENGRGFLAGKRFGALAAGIVAAAALAAGTAKGEDTFLRVDGTDIVDEKGEKFFIRGVNLGNWLNPEGYMFGFGSSAASASAIEMMVRQAIGPEEAAAFWRRFRENYVTREDVRFIAATGANTVRLPFHYRLFTEEAKGEGFAIIDRLVDWCKEAGLRIVLDMHCCPGGQTGDNIDDSDGGAWLFTSGAAQETFCGIWRDIARRYADEPAILGYDLMNEPISHELENKDELNALLEGVMKRALAAVREVDARHIVMFGGAQWNNNFSVFKDWDCDANLMFTCHRYQCPPEGVGDFFAFRDKVRRPMYMGETGHNTYDWIRRMRENLEKHNVGYTFWPYKMRGKGGWVKIAEPEGWDEVVAFAKAPRATFAEIRKARKGKEAVLRKALNAFARNCRLARCEADGEYIAAMGLIAPQKTTRDVLPLDGEWHYIVDPQEQGFYNYHHEEEGSFARNRKPKDKTDLVEYSFADAPTLHVPGDWNTQKKELFWYEGAVWYERDFEWTRTEDGSRAFLVFDAANYETHVWVNGKKAGRHEGGFSPFEFDVTSLLEDGENFIVAKVDNRRRADGVPALDFDWWNYGGITRSVRIETRPENHIAHWQVRLAKDRTTLNAEVRMAKPVAGVVVKIEIPEAAIAMEGVTDAAGCARLQAAGCHLDLWSPESPRRYKGRVDAGDDCAVDEMGFSTIESANGKILLNGKEVFLKGVCFHDEAANGGGRVATLAQAMENIRRAKELGCNFVRLAHYPHNELTVRACEREGLMVWSEIPLYWAIDWTGERTYRLAQEQMRDMILRDVRRGNIVVWSLANETPRTPQRGNFLRRLAAAARAIDSTRLVSMAMEASCTADGVNRITDDLQDAVDIIAFNEYIGWYRNAGEIDSMEWDLPQEKPVVISEFGGGALAGRHGAKDERWTEEMQEAIYEAQVRMFQRMKGLCGTCPWVLTDFRSPRRALTGIQDGWNRKGLFAPDGTKKRAFRVMQDFYRKAAETGKSD